MCMLGWKTRPTKLMMNDGGRELGCCGIELMWLMSWDVKFMEAVSASVQAGWPDVGEAGALTAGEGARESSFGSGWARGAQLSVYMVLSGIS